MAPRETSRLVGATDTGSGRPLRMILELFSRCTTSSAAALIIHHNSAHPPSPPLLPGLMHPRPRHSPPRSPPSLSRRFVACKKTLVLPRLAEFLQSGKKDRDGMEDKWNTNTNALQSDGIARVYGMRNVQAEELVEYVLHAIAKASNG